MGAATLKNTTLNQMMGGTAGVWAKYEAEQLSIDYREVSVELLLLLLLCLF
jgi:hypothetical protein